MHFETSFDWHLGDEVEELLSERRSLSIAVTRAVSVTPVAVKGSAIAVRAGTIGSSVIANFGQWSTIG